MTISKFLTVCCWLAPSLALAQAGQFPGTIERCRIIAQEMKDYDDNTRVVFERFCEMLHSEAPPLAVAPPAPSTTTEASPPDYFVKCVVATDPDWIGFRLVTRQQCDEMQGNPVQAEEVAKRRDFGPK